MSHHHKHNRDDKRERWDMQTDWRNERDDDLQEQDIPEPDYDDPPPSNTLH